MSVSLTNLSEPENQKHSPHHTNTTQKLITKYDTIMQTTPQPHSKMYLSDESDENPFTETANVSKSLTINPPFRVPLPPLHQFYGNKHPWQQCGVSLSHHRNLRKI